MKYLSLFLLMTLLKVATCNEPTIVPQPEEAICSFEHTIPAINNDTLHDFKCHISVDMIPLNDYEYYSLVFNPNNPNELAFLRTSDVSSYLWDICIYNLCTGETQVILKETSMSVRFDWSKKGWFIFNGANRQIYKVKANGDSLIQLTHSGVFNRRPQWNEEGTEFIFQREQNGQWLLRADEHGHVLDTLEYKQIRGSNYSWSNGVLCYFAEDSLCIYDVDTHETTVIDDLGCYGALPVYLKSRNSLLWSSCTGIYLTNIETKERTCLLSKTGSNRNYLELTISPDEKMVGILRGTLHKVDECTALTEAYPYLIDITGENERRLLIEAD